MKNLMNFFVVLCALCVVGCGGPDPADGRSGGLGDGDGEGTEGAADVSKDVEKGALLV